MAKKQPTPITEPETSTPEATTEAKVTPVEAKATVTRRAAATQAIRQLKEPCTRAQLNVLADSIFVASGGKSDLDAENGYVRDALKVAEEFGLVKVEKREVTITPITKQPVRP